MMDKLSNIKHMLHMLKYDSEYSDLSGYVADIEKLLKENESLLGENREIKQQYIQTGNKLNTYKKANQKKKLAMQHISSLASQPQPDILRIKYLANGGEGRG